jgi:predicted transcriptional regulator
MRAGRENKLATRITVTVDEQDLAQLTNLAEKYRVSLAWLVRYAVSDMLDRHQQDQLQLPLDLTTPRR